MNPLISAFRSRRARDGADSRRVAASGDDSLGRGMDVALTLLVFLGIGWLVDAWLGIFPAFTIGLVVFAAVGSFVRLKYVYDARMEQLEAERRAAGDSARPRSAAVASPRPLDSSAVEGAA